jgi:hypothetical protein
VQGRQLPRPAPPRATGNQRVGGCKDWRPRNRFDCQYRCIVSCTVRVQMEQYRCVCVVADVQYIYITISKCTTSALQVACVMVDFARTPAFHSDPCNARLASRAHLWNTNRLQHFPRTIWKWCCEMDDVLEVLDSHCPGGPTRRPLPSTSSHGAGCACGGGDPEGQRADGAPCPR